MILRGSIYFKTNCLRFLGLTFLYASEIAPLSVRVPVTSISTGTAWLFNFMVAEVTPVGFSTIGYRFYIVWAVLNLCLILPCKFQSLRQRLHSIHPAKSGHADNFLIGVYFFFPETSGRSLEEVDEIFESTSSVFSAVSVANKLPRKHMVKRGVALTVDDSKPEANHDNIMEVEAKIVS